MKLLTENNNHVFISGQTRSGKTYFAAEGLARLKSPVLFFNLQEEKLPARFMKVNYQSINTEQLLDSLDNGAHLDFRLPFNAALSNNLQGHIISELLQQGFTEKHPVYLVLDECHLLKGRGLEKSIEAATRGLKRGVRCVFITQRPALCNKTLYTQSAEQYIFYLASSEKEYLKNKGLDYESCRAQWEQLGQYSYIFYDGFHQEGRRGI